MTNQNILAISIERMEHYIMYSRYTSDIGTIEQTPQSESRLALVAHDEKMTRYFATVAAHYGRLILEAREDAWWRATRGLPA